MRPYVHPEAFLTIAEAASISGIAVGTLNRWVGTRKIRSFGYRGAIRVRLCDVLPSFEPVVESHREPVTNPRGKINSGSKFKKAATAAGETTKDRRSEKKGRR